MPICPNCKNEYREGREFCPKCGYYFEGERRKKQKKMMKTVKTGAVVAGTTLASVALMCLIYNSLVKKKIAPSYAKDDKQEHIATDEAKLATDSGELEEQEVGNK